AILCGEAKSWESESEILLKKFFMQYEIDSSRGSFSRICSNRLSRFIWEAAARRKTGRWKSGLLCFREAVISRSTKTNASGPADCLPLSSFQARRIRHRRSYWNASGKIQWSV